MTNHTKTIHFPSDTLELEGDSGGVMKGFYGGSTLTMQLRAAYLLEVIGFEGAHYVNIFSDPADALSEYDSVYSEYKNRLALDKGVLPADTNPHVHPGASGTASFPIMGEGLQGVGIAEALSWLHDKFHTQAIPNGKFVPLAWVIEALTVCTNDSGENGNVDLSKFVSTLLTRLATERKLPDTRE